MISFGSLHDFTKIVFKNLHTFLLFAMYTPPPIFIVSLPAFLVCHNSCLSILVFCVNLLFKTPIMSEKTLLSFSITFV